MPRRNSLLISRVSRRRFFKLPPKFLTPNLTTPTRFKQNIMLFQDPLKTGELLRRTRDNEAVDGLGNKFYLEQKAQIEFPPFGALLAAALGVAVALALVSCGGAPSLQPAYEQPQSSQSVKR